MESQSRCTGMCLYENGEEGMFVGWAINVLKVQEPTVVSVYIDDQEVAEVTCSEINEKIQKKLNFFRSDIGFKFVIPEGYRDGRNHKLSFRFVDDSVMFILDERQRGKQVPFIQFNLVNRNATVKYLSSVDGWQNGSIVGWVFAKNVKTGRQTGNCQVLVTMNGVELKTVQANRYRGDVASVYGVDARCGFAVVVPMALRRGVKAEFRVYVLPERIELQNSPYTTSLIDDLLAQKLLVIDKRVDSLYKEIAFLRTQVKSLIAYPEYVLDEYAVWAQAYYAFLPQKLERQRKLHKAKQGEIKSCLVSIICPVYKPEQQFFEEAVQSVLNQTWSEWELILVDDGGQDPLIQKRIQQFVQSDPRIGSVTLKKNQGISAATNAGLKKAKGQWIAFFDHDDALVPEAVEMMVLAARMHDAELVYSDEDKLDLNGVYTEPNLKPDFNYRYLLGCNYICHFVMVQSDLVKKAGWLKTEYNGAQDHDFLLRLTELTEPSRIHHVSEILYHWRVTKNSTAETIANKHYAVEAGINAVQDHLTREGKAATVLSLLKATIYHVEWNHEPEETVAIIIPFKDQVKMTRKCVDHILEKTRYENYTVILVDNGSIEPETIEFIRKYSRKKRVQFFPVHEEFNFSRLNNLATRQVKADFYLFLNNDVFVENRNWLNKMLNEAVLFKDVAVVGAKLLYPNGRVQHGGVIVGPGEVAQHMNRGLRKDEPGYCGRSILPQELSAVTAAMMLVRASVFHQVGGFDENHLKIAYNDVDFCLRVREAGYRIIMAMDVVAVHHESFSRGSDDQPQHQERFAYETEYMERKWGGKGIYQNDPAYSLHFKVKPRLFYELDDPVQS